MKANTILGTMINAYKRKGGTVIVDANVVEENYKLTELETERLSKTQEARTIRGKDSSMDVWDLTTGVKAINFEGTNFIADTGDTAIARFGDGKILMYPSLRLMSESDLFTMADEYGKANAKSFNKGDFVDCSKCITIDNYVAVRDGVFPNEHKGKFHGIVRGTTGDTATVEIGDKYYRMYSADIVKLEIGDEMFLNVLKELGEDKKLKVGDIRYAKFEDGGQKVSFITPNRLKAFEGDFWNEEKRARLGTTQTVYKVMNKFIGNDPDAVDSALVKAGLIEIEVDILKGDKIYDAFVRDNNIDKGTLGNSCMLGKPREWFDFYAENSNCSVAVYKINGKIALRAILWDAEYMKSGKQVKVMDRIYASSTKDEKLFMGWATKNGYCYLPDQCTDNTKGITGGDKNIDLTKLVIKLENVEFNHYPYCDTFPTLIGNTLSINGAKKRLRSWQGSHD